MHYRFPLARKEYISRKHQRVERCIFSQTRPHKPVIGQIAGFYKHRFLLCYDVKAGWDQRDYSFDPFN